MPWLGKVQAVMEAWYPGARGGEAIADALFGRIDPSAACRSRFLRRSRNYRDR